MLNSKIENIIIWYWAQWCLNWWLFRGILSWRAWNANCSPKKLPFVEQVFSEGGQTSQSKISVEKMFEHALHFIRGPKVHRRWAMWEMPMGHVCPRCLECWKWWRGQFWSLVKCSREAKNEKYRKSFDLELYKWQLFRFLHNTKPFNMRPLLTETTTKVLYSMLCEDRQCDHIADVSAAGILSFQGCKKVKVCCWQHSGVWQANWCQRSMML